MLNEAGRNPATTPAVGIAYAKHLLLFSYTTANGDSAF
jgi:hypothetical protein